MRGRRERNSEGGSEMGAEKGEKNSPSPLLYAHTHARRRERRG